ncbi:MAG: MFS transporter [Clostridia bacterium]|nr:MFS transporter [Clostridia bacterium]
MPTLKVTRGKYLMVLLAMCGLVASTIGIMTNTAGLFLNPICMEFGKETAAVNLTITISNLAFAVAGLFSARYIGAKNFRLTVTVCTAVFAGCTAGLALCTSLIPLYILNGIRGFAGGMIGSVLATTVLGYWFRTDTGLISSLALGCSGLIGALFNPILEAVINGPGWRAAYLTAAAVIVVLNLPAILLPIAFRPADAGLESLRAPASAKGSRRAVREPRTGDSRAPAVFILIIVLFAFLGFVSATPQLFKSLAISSGLAETGVAMMTVVLITNTAGKFLFGAMTDRLGVRISFLIYGAAVSLGLLLLLLVREPVPMLVSAALIGLCYSVPTVGAVMICRELFSPVRYTQVYPKLSLGISAANAFGYPLLGAIYDRTGSYDGALILVLALTLVSMLGVIAVYLLADREKAKAASGGP